jgi:ATP/ADP translocase
MGWIVKADIPPIMTISTAILSFIMVAIKTTFNLRTDQSVSNEKMRF